MGNGPSKAELEELHRQFGISIEDLKTHAKAFREVNGAMTLADFRRFSMESSTQLPPGVIEKIFFAFDRNRDGRIDVREYLMMISLTRGGTLDEKLQASFDIFDSNRDGKLEKYEVRSLLEAANVTYAGSISLGLTPQMEAHVNDLVEQTFELSDTNHDGFIDREEFVHAFKTHPKVLEFFKQL
ncbi:hypothetical protein Pelo_12397 [Pelomyxa schiedti]|nr:hypothetical protein Pelo_12397 [Pelomyxa schiedti]